MQLSSTIHARSLIALAAASLMAGLGGCAWHAGGDGPEAEAEQESVSFIEGPMERGVSWVTPESDVVVMEPSYQHVVLPSGQVVAYRPGWDDSVLMGIAESLDDDLDAFDKAASEFDEKEPRDERDTAAADQDEAEPEMTRGERRQYKAWKRLCDGKLEELSDGDVFLIQTMEMPEALQDECDERAALGQLK